jgi:hypothetical protein
MNASYASLQVNPFEDDVVREPRDVSFSVHGLNDAPLNALVRKFSALDAGELPRSQPVRAAKAQLVVSPDRGYGKSHLLGRLFAKLGGRATKVYLRPFQDPFKAWHSILLLTIQELERPDDEKAGAPTQLEALAVGTLAHVAADFIAEDGIPDYPEAPHAVEFLRKVGVDLAIPEAQIRPWIDWVAKLIADPGTLRRLALRLGRRGIDLHGREKAWLRVLAAHALCEPYGESRSAAVKWLRPRRLRCLASIRPTTRAVAIPRRRRSMILASGVCRAFANSLLTIAHSYSASIRPSFTRAIPPWSKRSGNASTSSTWISATT